jgi:DNA adenine methylase
MGDAVFPYPGNKSTMANDIISTFPDHQAYVEVFGGAGGVLFSKEPSYVEIYNDKDSNIVHFFRILRDHCEELKEWLDSVPYSRELYEEWVEDFYSGDHPDDDIERAGRFFFLRYAQFGAVYSRKVGFSTAINSTSPAISFNNKAERLNDFSDRLSNVIIEDIEAFELVKKYDSENTLFYCDPPYIDVEGDKYRHHSFNHNRFRKLCADIEGYAVISYEHVPDCYESSKWSIRSINTTHHINSPEERDEVLIMNFDPDEKKSFASANMNSAGEADW